MKKLLYVGHPYHNKTKSSQFILDIFKTHYEITEIDFDPYNESFQKFNPLKGQFFDVLILWQVMPSLTDLEKFIKTGKKVFFPMYDNTNNLNETIWNEYRDCIIINFSKTLHEKCLEYGLASFYIQYFPKPEDIENWGDEKSVFFWQRVPDINPDTINNIIGIENVSNLYLHIVPDPNKYIKPIKDEWNTKVKFSSWFESKDELKQYIQKSAMYFAPRLFEGIGMSFLDAMAVGRCVIAPNNPTMNEYITNGVNGYLYNFKEQKKLDITNIREIQKNTIEYIKQGYENFEKNKHKILDWIETDAWVYSNQKVMDLMLNVKPIKKYKITWLKIVYTKKYITAYLLGLLPIRIPRKLVKI